ncbi:DUF1636 domain-containing protein [Brevundimonas diminuta]|jgi:predicted metal-binding protein|uniref:DUF1636 domain-containing protein n=2 Tax=Pseudomonadota TaxID=1224 RepID=A0A410P1D4_BREDI|nr:DUF1636 domain-containing protein [Brevundimonas diminuta]MBD3573696.1 DUF1636 domain-containing protein [Brevundimonas diminuta]QAT15907.1 DUF1636 domain-containing protein [Brevundimonas diminuta]QQB89875.1 DUF1636 domain-containing protein [Brevundimonas diminuta]GEC01343.1 hypothetical protein BDI01nite_24070 [Brevundimonas diminuta]HRL06934.1 DUF1636 domain-containing protein [Brevundimonas diminuta]
MTEATARLVVCSTCRLSTNEPVDADGVSGGRLLLQAVATAARGAPELRVEEQACLWACRSHCTVYLAQGGKPGYLAGTFTPTAEAAEAIVDFARRYVASPDGAVPYRDWPEGMKGHFIARLPQDA